MHCCIKMCLDKKNKTTGEQRETGQEELKIITGLTENRSSLFEIFQNIGLDNL